MSFRPNWGRALLFLCLGLIVPGVFQHLAAAIAFDGVGSVAATNAVSVNWTHTVTAATDTVLVVGLALEDTSSAALNVLSITYDGVPLAPIATSLATDGTATLNRSQLYYLFNPGAGSHSIAVSFQGSVNGVSAGSISLSGVLPTPPSGASGVSDSGSAITTTINVPAAGAWLVDTICSGAANAGFTPSDGAMVKQWETSQSNSGGAGSTKAVASSGPVSMAWSTSSSSRLAHSIALFSPSGQVGTAPVITQQPASRTVAVGQSATLSVIASGTAPLSYQWAFNGALIPGAVSSTFPLTNIQLSDAGSYSVKVSNFMGSVTSRVASLIVFGTARAPTITAQPASQTVPAGGTVTFSVSASGTAPFSYQWKFNGVNLAGASNPTLTLSNVTTDNAGAYTVAVLNSAGSALSSPAVLTVNVILDPPLITTQPASQLVSVGTNVTFGVVASGTPPLFYQWEFNGAPVVGAVQSSLAVSNVQLTDAGEYTVTVSNAANSTRSNSATLTVTSEDTTAKYNLTGFATTGPGTTGGGLITETSPAYRKITTPAEFADAILVSNKSGTVRVIEIMNDLDLGWNEVGAAVQATGAFREHNPAQLHPVLLSTGVSIIDIKAKGGGLTLFSANGSTIRHATLNLKGTSNIIIRNLKFDEMWEWDEATKGAYDKNDWDFIDLGNGSTVNNVWIDHCTFGKSYDGEVDIKGGSFNITFSWNKYVGDDGDTNPDSWVRLQIAALEANRAANPMYDFLRSNGFSVEDIVAIEHGHDKTHLIGSTALTAANAAFTVTFHHQWWLNPWDRLPRLRAGNVHNYNIYVDDTQVLAAKRLRDARAAAMSAANRLTLNNTYSFNPPINGSISTENGALLVEKSVYIDCLWPLRNNQTNPNDPAFTGKIKALDSIYIFDQADGTTTTVRGDSTDAGNPLGPFQAPIIPFSWNLAGDVLPYTYTTDDPASLLPLLQVGAGAGVLTWDKSNWLKVSY